MIYLALFIPYLAIDAVGIWFICASVKFPNWLDPRGSLVDLFCVTFLREFFAFCCESTVLLFVASGVLPFSFCQQCPSRQS